MKTLKNIECKTQFGKGRVKVNGDGKAKYGGRYKLDSNKVSDNKVEDDEITKEKNY